MAFLDFFWKKAKNLADTSVQETVFEMNRPLAEINNRLAEQGDHLRRIETRQKETSLQLEELDNFLQSSGGAPLLVDALIALVDIIEDFYYFAATDPYSPLFDQARMMKNAAANAAETAGLMIIDPANEPFDFRLHTAESTGEDNGLPNGYVIKTLKCGYIYKEEIIRRAAVVINKIKETEKVEETEEV